MKIITGSTGTPHVTSNNAGELHQAIFGDGNIVFDIGEALEATLVDNNNITIGDGDLMIQGRHALIEPGLTENVEIDTGALGVNRHDLIVARYELDSGTGHESITLQVIKGTESSGEASDPTYSTGDIRTGSTIVDFPLYRVVITGINITSVVALFTPMSGISADNVGGGMFGGTVKANSTAVQNLNVGMVRNITISTTPIEEGDPLATGEIYLYIE